MCTFTHEQQLQIPNSFWRHRAPHTSVLQTRSTPATQPISPPVPQNTTDDSRLQATTKICCSKGSICSYQCPTVTRRVTRHLSYSPSRAPAAVPVSTTETYSKQAISKKIRHCTITNAVCAKQQVTCTDVNIFRDSKTPHKQRESGTSQQDNNQHSMTQQQQQQQRQLRRPQL